MPTSKHDIDTVLPDEETCQTIQAILVSEAQQPQNFQSPIYIEAMGMSVLNFFAQRQAWTRDKVEDAINALARIGVARDERGDIEGVREVINIVGKLRELE